MQPHPIPPTDAVRRSALLGLSEQLEQLQAQVETLTVAIEQQSDTAKVNGADAADMAQRLRETLEGMDQFGWSEASR